MPGKPFTMTLDPKVADAMLQLMALIKPYHDHYFTFALGADLREMDKLTKYIRKRSHDKGSQWKEILFFLVDFITITEIPPTPAFPVNEDQDIPEILSGMLEIETTIRKACEAVMGVAYTANEQRVVLFLRDYVKDQAKTEIKIDRMRTLWGELNGDVYEFEKMM